VANAANFLGKMSKHQFKTTVEWTGNKGVGTTDYRAYERSHTIQTSGKVDIKGSSAKVFRGDDTKHNPEDLLVGSLSACHLLWYLHLCAEAGVVVVTYRDETNGEMQVERDGSGRFTEVVLRPFISVQSSEMLEKAHQLHEFAHKKCFIANSVNFEVRIEPTIVVANE
jgi:organic hydroperoxide reductase OsmC/OhrA